MPDSEATGPDAPYSELDKLQTEFDRLMANAQTWQLWWGPFRIRARLGSQRLAAIFTAFHFVVVVTGSMLLIADAQGELGLALVIGGLFAFGAFLAQVWALQCTKEMTLFADDFRNQLSDLQRRWDAADAAARARPGDAG
ncbi:hypothetical protein [Phytoactinopolyspora endophytica]|uniref:hypothetical protein n=1 Tax=Phytoactinopolyspora endophytica TaxID=1642495 RepID=UPI00101CEF15|nr:hypothetical protein [Phytoactinopolyspora endophytica]